MAKNLLLWVVIAIILMSVFNNFSNKPSQARTMPYSQFIADVKSGQVARVTVDGPSITGTLQSGESFGTYSPENDNSAMIGDLLKNNVVIDAQPPAKRSVL